MAKEHPTGKVCKICKVDVVVVKGKVLAVLGKEHKPGCPRRKAKTR